MILLYWKSYSSTESPIDIQNYISFPTGNVLESNKNQQYIVNIRTKQNRPTTNDIMGDNLLHFWARFDSVSSVNLNGKYKESITLHYR
jgi:hypothetical protein